MDISIELLSSRTATHEKARVDRLLRSWIMGGVVVEVNSRRQVEDKSQCSHSTAGPKCGFTLCAPGFEGAPKRPCADLLC